MPTFLQMEFPHHGPWAEELVTTMAALARDIAQQPELRWKYWTEDAAAEPAGGIYLFASREQAESYLEKHRSRLEAAGCSDIRARLYEINPVLSAITRAPV